MIGLFGFLALLDDFGQAPKRFVNRLMVREVPNYIGVNDDNVGPFSVPLGVLATDAAAEIIFLKYIWINLQFLYIGISSCLNFLMGQRTSIGFPNHPY